MSKKAIKRGQHRAGCIYEAVRVGESYHFDSVKITHAEWLVGFGYQPPQTSHLEADPLVRDIDYCPSTGILTYRRSTVLCKEAFKKLVLATLAERNKKGDTPPRKLLALCESLSIEVERDA